MQPLPFRILMVACGLCGMVVGVGLAVFAVLGFPIKIHNPHLVVVAGFLAALGGAVLLVEKIMGGEL